MPIPSMSSLLSSIRRCRRRRRRRHQSWASLGQFLRYGWWNNVFRGEKLISCNVCGQEDRGTMRDREEEVEVEEEEEQEQEEEEEEEREELGCVSRK